MISSCQTCCFMGPPELEKPRPSLLHLGNYLGELHVFTNVISWLFLPHDMDLLEFTVWFKCMQTQLGCFQTGNVQATGFRTECLR